MPTPASARVFIEYDNHGHGGFHRHDLFGLRGRADAALSSVPGEFRPDAICADDRFRSLCGEPPRSTADGRLAVGLYRPPARYHGGAGAEHRRDGDVRRGGYRRGPHRRPRGARLRDRARYGDAGRDDPRYRSSPRANVEQRDRIRRADGRKSGRGGACDLRSGSAAIRLCWSCSRCRRSKC